MIRIICLLIGYLFGCIQTAYITGKITSGIDIREHGSGNAGTSNVIRVIGRSAGFIVFVGDVLKTIAAYMLCSLLFGGGGSFLPQNAGYVLPGLYAGLGVVLGHNFPVFLKFKGGKGIASVLGLALVMDWRPALIIYVIGFLIVVFTRYISLASLVMSLLLPVMLLFFGYGFEVVAICFFLAAMAFYLHRGNISRLRNGTERKLLFGGKPHTS